MAPLKRPLLAAALTILISSSLPQCLSLPTTIPTIKVNNDVVIPAELCADNTTIANLWTVESLRVTYATDLTRDSGRASFQLTNTRTNFTESLSCPLRANYVCEYTGTPADPGLNIWMQLHIETAYVTINQSWSCNDSISAYAVGMAEVTLTCPDDFYEKGLACVGADETGSANGTVTTAAKLESSEPLTLQAANLQKREGGATHATRPKMEHKIESIDTIALSQKGTSTTTTSRTSSGRHNLDFADDLRRKTWQALDSIHVSRPSRQGNWAQSHGRPRHSTTTSSKSRSEIQNLVKVPAMGLFQSQTHKEEEDQMVRLQDLIRQTVDIEHLCSPSCLGAGPKPPVPASRSGEEWTGVGLKERDMDMDMDMNIKKVFGGSGGTGHGNRGGPSSVSVRGRGRGTNPVRPGVVFVDV